MKRVVIFTIILLALMLLISCPKNQVKPPSGADQPVHTHLIHRPFMKNADLQERINNTKPGEYVIEPWFDTPLLINISFHYKDDAEGKYISKLPDGDIDIFDMFKKLYSISYDCYLPEIPTQLFLGVREAINGEIVKHCIKIQPNDQIEILNKAIEINLLSLNNPDHKEKQFDLYEQNIDREFINVQIGTTFVSSLYPENKQTIDAFVAWFENKYYSTLNKPENKVTAFPWDCPDLPRPEKY